MKKIVLISDGKHFSKKVFEFIQALYQQEPFLLTGAFFHSINYELLISTTFAAHPEPFLNFTKDEHDEYLHGIQQFKALCCAHNIEHVVHEESKEWNVNDLVKESRFADVVVVSGEDFFVDVERDQPNRFLRDVLNRSECPVLILPENVEPVKRIGIAYDGKKESIFAIKMFCYTFAHLTGLPVDVYYWVNKTDDDIPEIDFLEEYCGRHFSDLNFKELFFDHDKYLSTWMNDHKDTLFILGSYHRSSLSTLLRKNFADDIIKKHSVAVFVAHH
jgi:hypothetical protein